MSFYITGGAEHDEAEANKDQRIAELERVLLEISKISQRPGFAAGLLEICGNMAREELEKRK